MEISNITNAYTAMKTQNVQGQAQMNILSKALDQGGQEVVQLMQGMQEAAQGAYASVTGVGGVFDAQA